MKFLTVHIKDEAWHARQQAHTKDLLAILDRRATPKELADALAIVTAPRNPVQPSIFRAREIGA